ncbi:MAG: DUF3592 domain-containing protein [Clostridiales bacterium]|nr:DUF3592 domain-containing protein [Clostridiales bacterium]
MEENKRKRKKTGINPLKIVLAVALIVAGACFEVLQVRDNNFYDTKVTAVVADVEERYKSNEDKYQYRANCRYEVDGQQYSYDTPWRDNKYYKGDEITITVNSRDPGSRNRHLYSKAGWVCFCMAGIILLFFRRS